MLTRVDIDNLRGTTLSLPLQPTTPGYVVREITGLDPTKATIVSSSYALLDGEDYQSSKIEKRNITMRIGLEPYFAEGVTVEQLRAAIYRCVMPGANVKLRFFIDGVETYTIEAYAETVETSLFSKDPEVSMSFLCFYPHFAAVETTVISDNSVSVFTEKNVVSEGNVPCAFIVQISVNRSISEVKIMNAPEGLPISWFTIGYNFINGDIISINTYPGSKYVAVTRSGVTTSILWAVEPASVWSMIMPGTTNFNVRIAGAPIPYVLAFREKFGGF